jgi:hypothetical protein
MPPPAVDASLARQPRHYLHLKLARRGVDLTRSPATRHLQGLTVATAMQPLPNPLPADAPLTVLARR